MGSTTSGVEPTERECWERLRNEAYGRLGVIGPEGPVIYPINSIVDHGSIVFRVFRSDPRVVFDVDGWDTSDDVTWSVLVTGLAKEVVRLLESATSPSSA